MIEQAERLGEHLDDPLLLYSVLYGFFIVKFINFDGDAACALAQQFLVLAEQQKATAPTMIGHRLLGNTLLCMGKPAEALSHLDSAWALYDPAEHRPLATRFGHDVGVATLIFRPLARWLLGCPDAVLEETERAIAAARATNHMPTLLFALSCTAFAYICCGETATAVINLDECIALAQGKVPFYSMLATTQRGCALAQTGEPADAVHMINSGTTGLRSTGATVFWPWFSSHLAESYAQLGQFDDAWRCIDAATTAIATTKESWGEAEVHRVAGEIVLMSSDPDARKAEACFMRGLMVARRQHAKSWELRTSLSLARLWRSQGKVREAYELLVPVYGWFPERSDTLDLREAKTLLNELAA